MNPPPRFNIIIQGITLSGQSFRPSDWTERLSGVMSTFGKDCRLCYSPHVKPICYRGVKSVQVNKKLWELDARGYDFLLNFAQENKLQVIEDTYDVKDNRTGTPSG